MGINALQVRDVNKVSRIMLILVLSFGLLMLIGTVADRLSTIRDTLITGGTKAASRIWFALRLINYQLLPALYWKKIWIRARSLGP